MSDDNCLDAASPDGPVKLVRCHGMGGNQAWVYNDEDKTIRHMNTNKCLTTRKTIQIRPNLVIVWQTPCINNGPCDQNSSGKQIENRKLSKNFLFFPACDNQGENCKKNLLFESQKSV